MPPSLKKCESKCKCFTIEYPFYNVWTTDQIKKSYQQTKTVRIQNRH